MRRQQPALPQSHRRAYCIYSWRPALSSQARLRHRVSLRNLHLIYRRLAAIEEAHAEYWNNYTEAAGRRVPELRPSWLRLGLAGA